MVKSKSTNSRSAGAAATVEPSTALPGSGPAVPSTGDVGNELMAAMRARATALFEEQRDRAASEIASFGELLRRSAESLESDTGPVARYATEAGTRICAFADDLRHRTWDELSGDTADLARRWPMAFLAVATCAGFIAGRFLAASAVREEAAPYEPAADVPGEAFGMTGGSEGLAIEGSYPGTAAETGEPF